MDIGPQMTKAISRHTKSESIRRTSRKNLKDISLCSIDTYSLCLLHNIMFRMDFLRQDGLLGCQADLQFDLSHLFGFALGSVLLLIKLAFGQQGLQRLHFNSVLHYGENRFFIYYLNSAGRKTPIALNMTKGTVHHCHGFGFDLAMQKSKTRSLSRRTPRYLKLVALMMFLPCSETRGFQCKFSFKTMYTVVGGDQKIVAVSSFFNFLSYRKHLLFQIATVLCFSNTTSSAQASLVFRGSGWPSRRSSIHKFHRVDPRIEPRGHLLVVTLKN